MRLPALQHVDRRIRAAEHQRSFRSGVQRPSCCSRKTVRARFAPARNAAGRCVRTGNGVPLSVQTRLWTKGVMMNAYSEWRTADAARQVYMLLRIGFTA